MGSSGWREQTPTRLSPSLEGWTRTLPNLNQLESLVLIAEQQGGEFRVFDARDILIGAKKIAGNPANAYGHLLKLLRGSERFERIARGTWRLQPVGAIDTAAEEWAGRT